MPTMGKERPRPRTTAVLAVLSLFWAVLFVQIQSAGGSLDAAESADTGSQWIGYHQRQTDSSEPLQTSRLMVVDIDKAGAHRHLADHSWVDLCTPNRQGHSTFEWGLRSITARDPVNLWSPDDSSALYVTPKNRSELGWGELWAVDVDGTNRRKLDDRFPLCVVPVWLPDGQRVAYVEPIFQSDSTADYNYVVVDANGTTLVEIYFSEPDRPETGVSPAGGVVFRGYNPNSWTVVHSDGSTTRLTNSLLDQIETWESPGWLFSAGGTQVILFRNLDLVILDSDGSGGWPRFNLSSLLSEWLGYGQGAAEPFLSEHYRYEGTTWSPDGSAITFRRVYPGVHHNDHYPSELWAVDPDGRNLRQLGLMWTSSPDITWSPDGARLIFSPNGSRGVKWSTLLVSELDGSGPRFLAQGADPAWSPDGSMVAFEWVLPQTDAWVFGVPGIWIIDSDGNNTRRVARIGENPVWSPDGKQIAYCRPCYQVSDDFEPAIWVVDSQGTEERKIAEGGALFPVWLSP